MFKKLVHLNLSQNGIERIESLQHLLFLETLNLSGNRIRVLQNLDGLKRLQTFNISQNKISLLQPFQIVRIFQFESHKFRSDGYNLSQIDIRCNNITDLRELTYLQGVETLQEIICDSEKKPNPICLNKKSYINTLLSLQNCPNLKFIDKVPISDLNSKNHAIDDHKSPFKQPIPNSRSPKKLQPDWLEREAEYRAELLQYQYNYEHLQSQNKELLYKFECNEKYWASKCANLEKEIVDSQHLIQDQEKDIKQLRREISFTKEEQDHFKREKENWGDKKEKKDQLIDQLQIRINDLLHENGRLQGETSQKISETEKLKQTLQEKERIIQDLKSSLRESEQQLSEFHQKAVQQASQALLRQEESQQKYEKILNENKTYYQDSSNLKRRIQEVLEICREWEVKFDHSQQESQQKLEFELQKQKSEFEKRMSERDLRVQEERQEIEGEFKKQQDHLESEVRKVLRENMEKYRQLKQSYDEQIRQQMDLKQMLNVTVARNQEQENLIGEMQNTLLKLKKELQGQMQLNLQLRNELDSKVASLERQVFLAKDETDQLKQSKSLLDKENRIVKEENQGLREENERLKIKARQASQLESEVEELQTTVMAKNKMLDDKNETIEDLKHQMEEFKGQNQTSQDDYVRLQKRYDKQGQIIEELEGQNTQLQEEIDAKNQELKEKKHMITLFEKEFDEIKDKQDTEIQTLRNEIQDKDKNTLDLVKLLDDARDNIKKKDEKFREKNSYIQQLEKKIREIDSQYEKIIQDKDREINLLKGRLEEAQEELKTLIQEVDRQKKAARENLEKLHKLFNY